ncbi:hypothetical protein HMPREF3034_00313 [Prevotella sp. DNF00663]|uniref:OmpP1/FadL family transporter n=1 Tax=Prevotella sp. DNF00663 TaxID=1384078 RepID=UPI0007833C55|nr:hypothetical protein [Prevotella sp. DNF00663]KXB85132.1 hypothetical protein HMPREF3034_00313 [Prevotella sp. DNF00663]
MNVKYYSLAAMLSLSLPILAQETYQDTKLIDNDLNGTARYVGMGGAMEALGADISTISTNPAGLGLFRRSQLLISGGLVSQQDAKTSLPRDNFRFDGKKTNMSFDQLGFVWSNRYGRKSFVNVGFNYHKSRNFDQILSAMNTLTNASQNKNTARKHDYGKILEFKYGQDVANMIWNGVDAGYAQMLSYDKTKGVYRHYNATGFMFGQYQKGYIGEYDFNISGNINDRVYLGLTLGYHDVHYRTNSFYTEDLAATDKAIANTWESLKITGSGFDIKFGGIFRPVADSPFRVGVYINTPIFYDLDMTTNTQMEMGTPDNNMSANHSSSYSYKLYTPWKFGLSLGHTVGNYLALGATYEYADYGTINNRLNTGSYYDGWSTYETTSKDAKMNAHTSSALKGVSTLKLGVEFKPVKDWAVRVGYNYLSPMFNKKAVRDGSVISPGTMNASSTDYTNWKSTNRFTCGVGYTVKKFNIDLAYQYSAQSGDFYPFMPYYYNADESAHPENNVADATKVNFKRHQLLLTLGYRF